MGKVIMLASGKGGSGTTTFTTNLGVVLSNTGSKVLICDMNIGLRNDDIYLGMENRVLFDIGDVISGLCSIDKAIIPVDCANNLYLLPCPQCKGIPGLNAQHVYSLLENLKVKYDYILVDCPSTIGPVFEFISAKADLALLIVTQDYLSVRNTDALKRKLDNYPLKNKFFVINKVTEESIKNNPTIDWIVQTLEINFVGIMAYDDEIHNCNNNGTPIALNGASNYIKSFIQIASSIVS